MPLPVLRTILKFEAVLPAIRRLWAAHLLFGLFSRVWLFFIRNPRQIIHARFKGYGKFSALLKGIVSFPIFQLGIITLIDAGHHLYFYLRISLFFPQFFQSVHVITQSYYVKFRY